MKNFETDLAEDTFGAERAISTLVSASLPTATKPQSPTTVNYVHVV